MFDLPGSVAEPSCLDVTEAMAIREIRAVTSGWLSKPVR